MTLEAVIWCPRCRENKYEVHRVPTQNENVFEHVTQPPGLTEPQRKRCACGTNLERKS